MKTEIKGYSENPVQHRRGVSAALAFTLIELVVVAGVVAMLATLLIPVLAGTKRDTAGAECQINMKQLGLGFGLFEQDHSQMFPPAAFAGGPLGGLGVTQLSWDSYIHRYIGGTANDAELTAGALYASDTPKALICPAAPDRIINWATVSGQELFGRRTYSMVGSPEYLQVRLTFYGSVPYTLNGGTSLGVGIYWMDSSYPADWDAKSFKTSVVTDPAGTILLVEQSENMNLAGNIWPTVSFAVVNSAYAGMLAQMDPAANLPAQGASAQVNMGKFLYRNHGYRFNYLFHDGHVQALTTNATIGTGTLQTPKGMWTVVAGD
jgi:prepilin-type processing-associated H-X9-DG protein